MGNSIGVCVGHRETLEEECVPSLERILRRLVQSWGRVLDENVSVHNVILRWDAETSFLHELFLLCDLDCDRHLALESELREFVRRSFQRHLLPNPPPGDQFWNQLTRNFERRLAHPTQAWFNLRQSIEFLLHVTHTVLNLVEQDARTQERAAHVNILVSSVAEHHQQTGDTCARTDAFVDSRFKQQLAVFANIPGKCEADSVYHHEKACARLSKVRGDSLRQRMAAFASIPRQSELPASSSFVQEVGGKRLSLLMGLHEEGERSERDDGLAGPNVQGMDEVRSGTADSENSCFETCRSLTSRSAEELMELEVRLKSDEQKRADAECSLQLERDWIESEKRQIVATKKRLAEDETAALAARSETEKNEMEVQEALVAAERTRLQHELAAKETERRLEVDRLLLEQTMKEAKDMWELAESAVRQKQEEEAKRWADAAASLAAERLRLEEERCEVQTLCARRASEVERLMQERQALDTKRKEMEALEREQALNARRREEEEGERELVLQLKHQVVESRWRQVEEHRERPLQVQPREEGVEREVVSEVNREDRQNDGVDVKIRSALVDVPERQMNQLQLQQLRDTARRVNCRRCTRMRIGFSAPSASSSEGQPAVDLWASPDRQKKLLRAFDNVDVDRDGILSWESGEVCQFVRLVFQAFHLPLPLLSDDMWLTFREDACVSREAAPELVSRIGQHFLRLRGGSPEPWSFSSGAASTVKNVTEIVACPLPVRVVNVPPRF